MKIFRIFFVVLVFASMSFSQECKTVFQVVEYSDVENLSFNGEFWQLSADKGFIETEISKSPLENMTGFAFRIKGSMDLAQALVSAIYWSYDGENWDGPITDDEVSITNPDKEPFSQFIFSDFYYPDSPPALYYKLMLHIEAKDRAKLGQLEMIYIDCGVSEEYPQPVSKNSSSDELCPMPSYVNRYGWGCEEAGDPTWASRYTDAWIWAIHHTAGVTAPSDPEATMRSIWYYHTVVNGWGDIGYQFVLDHLGTIYQGRYNSDLANLDAIGAHVGGHNTGCVGLSVMGDFETATVTSATLNALYDLVSWKCEQRDIDPHGSSWLVDGTYPNISGHRDIGSTACPGANFYPLLPSIRDTVANRLSGYLPPAGDTTIVDNGDAGYTTTGSWTEGVWSLSDGYLDDYQYCSIGGTLDKAIWTPNLPEAGTYDVHMWWYGGDNRCEGITVKIQGTSTNYLSVSQRNSGSSWHFLGYYEFAEGTSGYVTISDSTYSGSGCAVVVADAVMWTLRFPMSNSENIPEDFEFSTYPNPFNSSCVISGPKDAEYSISSLDGRLIENGILNNGELLWEPTELSSGTYLLRIQHNSNVMMSRLVYTK